MTHIGRNVLLLTFAAALAAACGSNAVNNPLRNFQITDELNGHIYVYQFEDSTSELRYVPERNLVLGINRSNDGTVVVAYFGAPVDDRTFSIVTAAQDVNGNGDFFDDPSVPVTGNSFGKFSKTGNDLQLVFQVQMGLMQINFNGSGSLTDIQDYP